MIKIFHSLPPQGHLDTPLSSLGLQQAECVATYLADTKFSQAISSDLSRALLTGQTIARANTSLGEAEVEQWEVMRERCFGDLEGGAAGVMQGRYPGPVRSLVQLLNYCTFIGRELYSDKIFP